MILVLITFFLVGTNRLNVSQSSIDVGKAVTTLKVDAKQLACMAKNIYYEAGHETITGQAAVARVVINRIRHGFGNNTCQVVYQKTIVEDKTICQFSWVCENKDAPINNSRYRQAQRVAYDVMVNNMYSDLIPNSTLFFHNTSVKPLWPYAQVAVIGNHVFYSKAKRIIPAKKTPKTST
jgi:spore germination cell wall hydrolase CwlJ-like protein